MVIERQQIAMVRDTYGVDLLHFSPVGNRECQTKEQSDAAVVFPVSKGIVDCRYIHFIGSPSLSV